MVERQPNPIDIHVGSRVRLRRILVGMSQERLGEEIGLTFQQIQKYECGANRISAARLWQLAEALESPISYFYDGLDEALELLGPENPEANVVTSFLVPEGVDELHVRRHMLERESIEIGAGLGPLAGRIFRVGLMGSGATRANADRLCAAFVAATEEVQK